MAAVRYLGPHDIVHIDGVPGDIARGASFDVSDDLAAALTAQESFELVPTGKAKAAPTTPAAAAEGV